MNMEIVVDELVALKEKYRDETFRLLFKSVEFVIYGVERGARVRAVCELLLHRPYSKAINLKTSDEFITVLEQGEANPALLIVEGVDENAGIAEMVNKFGARVFTVGFRVKDVSMLREALESRGAQFLHEGIRERNGVRSIATTQSSVTLDSYFYIERAGAERNFDFFPNAEIIPLEREIEETLKRKKRLKAFSFMHVLDHIAYRVHGADIVGVGDEFMRLTPFLYSEAHEIEEHDAKTIVFRFGNTKPALVASFGRSKESVVEQYVERYGPRVHHIAYEVSDIAKIVSLQRKRGMAFTTEEVIGARDEGIVQIFSTPSEFTNEITEYVQRFDGFTGFFSNKNVGNLMASTRAFQ